MIRNVFLILITLLVIGASVAGLPVLAQETPVPYMISEAVPYNPGDPAQTVTLYLPEVARRKPLTLFIPFGQYFPEIVDYFAGRGYVVISVGLRENGDFLTETHDAFCALAWAHTYAETYGFAPVQLVTVGGSMHGGLMALLAMIDDATPYLEECLHALPETGRVYGVVTLAGVFDYSQEADFFAGFIDTISAGYMGGTPTENPARWAEASAITWIDGNEPPFLLLHGSRDTNVGIHQSQIFAAALEDAGADVEFVPISRATHSSIIRDNEAFAILETFLERIVAQPIIFYSERDGRGNGEIYTMNPDGSDQQRLTFNKTDESSPVWSPDGTQVAFISDRNDAHPIACFPECNYDLYVMNADGSNPRQLTDTPYIESHPDWSPIGNRITFDADPDGNGKNAIYDINPDGSEPRPLTDGSADDCWGDWSPDGRAIVFSSNRDGNYELYLMNADGSNQRRLTNTPDLGETFPDWSPDGAQILFFSYPTRAQRQDIYVMDVDGTNLHQLTNSPRIVDEDPVWSPDGTQIVFQSDRDGNYELYIMNADGSNVRRLTNNRAGDYWPDW